MKRRGRRFPIVIAGAVVVLGAVAVWWAMRPSDELAARTEGRGKGKIAERRGGGRGDDGHAVGRVVDSSRVVDGGRGTTRPTGVRPEVVAEATAPEETNGVEKAVKKDTRLFKNQMDQLLAMVTPREVGDEIPPVPIDENDRFSEADEKKILERLTAAAEDTDATLERKELVQALRDEYQELKKKRGWSFATYVKELEAKAKLDSEVKATSEKLHDEAYNDKSISDEKYLETLQKINKVLTDRGIAPIDPNAGEEETTEDMEGEKSK